MRTKFAVLITVLLLAMCIAMCSTPAAARTRDTFSGRVKNADGDIFIIKNNRVRVGAFRYCGHLCYGRHRKTAWYPAGSLTTKAFRYIGKRCYYFGASGYAAKRGNRYVKIEPATGEVRWWYMPGSGNTWRYNTRKHRYEHKVHGRFVEVGMQCYPAEIERTY